MNIDDIACYDCGAEPGERCISRTGRPARRPHAFRRDDDQDRVVAWRAAEIAASVRMAVGIGLIPMDADAAAERVAAHLDSVAAYLDSVVDVRPTEHDRMTVLRLARLDNRGRPTLDGASDVYELLSHRRRFGDEVTAIGAALP